MMNSTIQLASGKYWDVQRPDTTLDSIDIKVIAHALSHICRFTGHTREFYSVAQHAVLCSRVYPEKFAYAKLMHDIAEAVLNDVASPLKRLLPDYKNLEHKNEHALFVRFGLDVNDSNVWSEVKRADMIMLATEKRDLMPPCVEGANKNEWAWLAEGGFHPLPGAIKPWGHKRAKCEFLARFYELCPWPLTNRRRIVWRYRVAGLLAVG